MKKTTFVLSLILTVILTSCGDSATNKLVAELNSSYTNDGKEVELTGYIFTSHIAIVSGDVVKVGLYNVAGQTDGEIAEIKIKFGKEANHIFIPEKYRGNEIEIYDNTGEKHGYLQKITVKGTVHYTNKDWEKETVAKEETGNNIKIFGKKSAAEKAEEAKQAAEKRKKETGDSNDYSFEFSVSEISVAK